MASDTLKGLKVAILVTDGFEKVELTQPRKALDEAGAVTRIVSPKSSKVRSWNFTNWDEEMPVDVNLDEAKPQDFDALHLPGGVIIQAGPRCRVGDEHADCRKRIQVGWNGE